MKTSASLTLVFALGATSLACSSSPSTMSQSSDGGSDEAAAMISFSSQVIPIFQTNCSTSGGICHGTTSVTTMMQPRPYLGPSFGTLDVATLAMVHDGIVGTPSGELPTMPYVTKNDPTQSFLFYKIAGTQGSLTCTDTFASPPCGLSMPFGGMPISAADQATIKSWIEQGAANN